MHEATRNIALLVADDHCNGQVNEIFSDDVSGWNIEHVKDVGTLSIYAFRAVSPIESSCAFDHIDCDEVWIVREGRIRVDVGDETIVACPNEPVLIPSNLDRIHTVETDRAFGYILKTNKRHNRDG